MLWQFESPILISSIPTFLSTFKFPPSLSKDQRNSWGEWRDGLRRNGYSWSQMDLGWRQDRTSFSNRYQVNPQHRARLPKLVREPACFLPQAPGSQQLFCFALTVYGQCLRAPRQCPPRTLEADWPWQGGWFATSPSQGQQTCHFSKCPPASINYRGWEGRGLANSIHFLKRYLHFNVNQQISYIQKLL